MPFFRKDTFPFFWGGGGKILSPGGAGNHLKKKDFFAQVMSTNGLLYLEDNLPSDEEGTII